MFGFQLKNLNYAILDLYVVIPFYMVKNCKQKKGAVTTVVCSDPQKLDFFGVEKSTPFFML